MPPFVFDLTPEDVPLVNTDFRTIKTPIPSPGTREILEKLAQYEARSMHGQLPIIWDRAEDFSIWDHAGNRWIDFTSTIFVANAGHANSKITQALEGIIQKKLLNSYTYAAEIRARYLEKLIEFTPPSCEKAFLLSAGTEATECAVKLMFMYGNKIGKRRTVVVSFEGAMHGRTFAAAQMGGTPQSRAWIACECPNFARLPFPFRWELEARGVDGAEQFRLDLDVLRARGIDPDRDVCGFMLESYLGWGAIFFPVSYVQALVSFARANGIQVCFDEIQAGFGRTGKLFAYQHYDVEPDLICCGKGMGSGIPLSGVLGRAEIMDLPDVGSMSSTHSANPIACAAGLANIEAFEELNLVAEAQRKGTLLHQALKALQQRFPEHIRFVEGRGMVAGLIVFDENSKPDGETCSRIAQQALKKGLIVVHTGRESIKIGPPLTIPDDALQEGVDVLGEAFVAATS